MKALLKKRFLLQTGLLSNEPLFDVDDEGDFLILTYLTTSGPNTAPGTIGPISFAVTDTYGSEVVPSNASFGLGYQGGEVMGASTPIHAVANSSVTISTGGSPAPAGSTYSLFVTIIALK